MPAILRPPPRPTYARKNRPVRVVPVSTVYFSSDEEQKQPPGSSNLHDNSDDDENGKTVKSSTSKSSIASSTLSTSPSKSKRKPLAEKSQNVRSLDNSNADRVDQKHPLKAAGPSVDLATYDKESSEAESEPLKPVRRRERPTYGGRRRAERSRRLVCTSSSSDSDPQSGSTSESNTESSPTSAGHVLNRNSQSETHREAPMEREESPDVFVDVPPVPTRRPRRLRRNWTASPAEEEEEEQTQLSNLVNELTLDVKDEDDLQDSIKDLLAACDQVTISDFQEVVQNLCKDKNTRCEKAGEASYSEVFRFHVPKKRATVLKVIPLRMYEGESDDGASLAADVLKEIKITRALHSLPRRGQPSSGSIELHSATVVKGPYPDLLLKAWDEFDNTSSYVEDIDPRSYTSSHIFCLVHLSDGGTDLERIKLKSWTESLIIFTQVLNFLSNAEESLHFEHRDLHWGNIVIRRKRVKERVIKDLSWKELSSSSIFDTQIIDFTLSRLTTGNETLFYDLEKDGETLFTGSKEVDYQFEVYRFMKCHLERDTKKWSDYSPGTNVFWLHYLVKKLLEEKAIKTTSTAKQEERDVEAHSRLTDIEQILQSQVARLTAVKGGSNNRRHKRAVQDVDEEEEVNSAADLRKWMQRKWG
ncbi:unnamed protein product [Sympodiomycopsis kandeliae]